MCRPDRSTPSRSANRSISLTNCLVIGAISADDANVAPRWSRKKPTTPDAYCNFGTYRFRYKFAA